MPHRQEAIKRKKTRGRGPALGEPGLGAGPSQVGAKSVEVPWGVRRQKAEEMDGHPL